jgi:hypothetical protein
MAVALGSSVATVSDGRGKFMAEVLRSFEEQIRHTTGAYRARVIGRYAEDKMWEGWLEFVPASGGKVVVSGVESRQPERNFLEYWAQGLTVVYAEGSLDRALHPITVRTRPVERPASDAPARRLVKVAYTGPRPILDPFEVGERSLDILAQELRALGRARLLHIIAGFNLGSPGIDPSLMTDAELIAFIVTRVEARLQEATR